MQESVQTEAYTEYLHLCRCISEYICMWVKVTHQNTGVGSCSPPQGDLPNPGLEPRPRTQASCIAGGFFTSWATREAHRYVYINVYITEYLQREHVYELSLRSFVPIYCHYFYQIESKIKFCHLGCLCQEIPEAPLMCLLTTFFLRVITFWTLISSTSFAHFK